MDPKLQTLLGDLESSLGNVVRKGHRGNSRGHGDSEEANAGDFIPQCFLRISDSLAYSLHCATLYCERHYIDVLRDVLY